MISTGRRALHFVLKIGNLRKNVEFFRDKLGMSVLRHEVFDKGCEAACNGPYSTMWSKTMIGYGPEDNHFVLELTYNYSIGSYQRGNDLQHIKIALENDLFEKVKGGEQSEVDDSGSISLESPDGYRFVISRLNANDVKQDITEVCVACKSLDKSINYWVDLLKMERHGALTDKNEALLRYANDQASLRLKQIAEDVDHKSAYGRIAFSCLSDQLKPLQKLVEDAKQTVLTPYLSLETPGKTTVQVVILADPDGHEICFVGDEGFRELSKVDPEANNLIEKSMRDDKSDEWFNLKKKTKSVA